MEFETRIAPSSVATVVMTAGLGAAGGFYGARDPSSPPPERITRAPGTEPVGPPENAPMDLTNQIGQEISNFEAPVVLVSVKPMLYQKAVLDTLRYFSERFGNGLYITLNKPTATLTKYFEGEGVGAGLVYLDSITNTAEADTDVCCFMGRMKELSDISNGLTKMVSSRKQLKFVLVDSVSTLLIYNDPKSVVRFCHACVERLRSWGLSVALVSVEVGEGMDMIGQLSQFCDAYVRAGD